EREEACDGSPVPTSNCSASCIPIGCGDGVVNGDEECDLGGKNSDSGPCTSSCKINVCGDGHKWAGVEQCDDGNTKSNDGCSGTEDPNVPACHIEFCGDGVVQTGEMCDPKKTPTTCNLDCTPSSCGDGKVNPNASPPEEGDSTDPSGVNCKLESCGNGVKDPGEDCDWSITNATGTESADCNSDCTTATCGDGKINKTAGEQCDDFNTSDNDDCLSHDPDPAKCKIAFCGDGKVDA